MTPRTEGEIFEEQVRHIASCLWSPAGHLNAQLVDGRERDAVFETDDVMHVVEATISRQKEKIEADCKKNSRSHQQLKKARAQQGRPWMDRDPPSSHRGAGECRGALHEIQYCADLL
jgi:hypothetical protein